MFDRRWPWRRERFISYQLTMVVCLAAQFAAIYSLFKYQDLQTHVQNYSRRCVGASLPPMCLDIYLVSDIVFFLSSLGGSALLHNDDIIAAELLTVIACVFVATIFSLDFLFLLFFPRREYPGWYNVARRVCVVVLSLGVLGAAVMSSVSLFHTASRQYLFFNSFIDQSILGDHHPPFSIHIK